MLTTPDFTLTFLCLQAVEEGSFSFSKRMFLNG